MWWMWRIMMWARIFWLMWTWCMRMRIRICHMCRHILNYLRGCHMCGRMWSSAHMRISIRPMSIWVLWIYMRIASLIWLVRIWILWIHMRPLVRVLLISMWISSLIRSMRIRVLLIYIWIDSMVWSVRVGPLVWVMQIWIYNRSNKFYNIIQQFTRSLLKESYVLINDKMSWKILFFAYFIAISLYSCWN